MLTKALILAALAAQTVATVNGTAKILTPDANEDLIPATVFRAVFEIVQTGTGTTDAKVQTSWDGTSWVDIAAATQVTAAGTANTTVAITVLGPQVRTVCVVTGAASSAITVRLVSNSDFKQVG